LPSIAAFNIVSASGPSTIAGVPLLAGRDAVFALAIRESLQKSGEGSLDLTAPWDSAPGGASGGPQLVQSLAPLPGANSVGLRPEGGAVTVREGAGAGDDPASALATDSFFAMLANEGTEE
jgi:hypothetical protein